MDPKKLIAKFSLEIITVKDRLIPGESMFNVDEKIIEVNDNSIIYIIEEKSGITGLNNGPTAGNVNYSEWIQKEGFRIEISERKLDQVSLIPVRIIQTVTGDHFPIYHYLNLVNTNLKIGDTYDASKHVIGSAPAYKLTLLDISQG